MLIDPRLYHYFYLYNILILPFLARTAKIITCASLDYVKHSDLRKYYQTKPDKFRQILFGVNLEQFVTYHDNLNKQRKNKVILFVGGLDKAHYFKGLEILLKALAQIIKKSELNSTILKIVGRGDLLDYYKNYAIKLGAEKNIKFYENVDNSKLVDFYNYSDCLVLPSINKSEAFGLVLLEAMACSTPLVASNLPGVRSVYKNGREGLLAKPGDANDLANKITAILRDRKLAERMGQSAKASADRHLNSQNNYLKEYADSILKTPNGFIKRNLLSRIFYFKKTVFNSFMILRYFICGITAAGANIFLLYIFTDTFGIWYLYSSVLAFFLALIISFVLQKFVVFRDTETHKVHRQFSKFFVVAVLGVITNTVLVFVCTYIIGIWYIISQIIAGFFVMIQNFILYKFFIFNKQ